MSNNIDDRIVQMQFNNREFERNIEQSSKSLEKFNEQLKFKDAKRGVKDLEATVRSMNLDSLKSAVDSLEHHFTDAFERLRVRVVDRFLDDMTNKFTQLIKRMTITPISAGWKKYEENTSSVQTIMAATGKSIEEVEAQMEKLMWFTDETSYSFTDMTSNIGKFTGAGVELETAVTAMQGIALWAAISGQRAQGASHAMYNLSQALGQGAVTALDWKSIQNVNMDTIEFKQRVIEAAKALGTLNKQGKTAKGTLVTAEKFYSTLSEKWFTSDVLLKVLKEYGEFADTMYEETRHGAIPASEAMAKYSGSVKTLGERAFRAGQEAITLTDALGSVDDATSTSWMRTWQLIFGNYEEAKVLFTDIANALWDIFNADNAIRNEALQIWHDLDKNENGRLDALQAVYDILDSIGYAAGKAREAIDSIFPNDSDTQLGMFKSITAQMVEASKTVRELLGYEEEITTSQTSQHHAFVEPFDDALKRGMRGEGVKEMQRRLEELGYSVGSAGVDGIFGPDTEAALKKFQKESQLLDPKHITLGLYDAQTQMALVSAAAGDVAVEVHSTSETVEHIGTYTEKIQTITKGIASVFSIIGKILNFGWGVIKLIVKTLAPAGNGLLTIIAAIAESFTSLNNTLGGDNPFSKWLDDIEKKLEPVKSKIESVTNSVLAFFGLTPKLDENGEALATNDDELMTFSKLWENVRTNLEESGALDRLSAAFENLKASIETIKATIKTWWNTLTESLGEKASENLTKLWDKMPGIAETVVNALTSVITWLGDKAGKVPDAINSVITWFTNLYTTLKESETLKKVGARLRAAFESIKKAFKSISPNASKWLESIKIMLFGGGEESEQKGLAGRLQDTIPSIIEKVGNALASALEFFSQVIENIPDNVTKIKDFFIDVYNGLKESETVKSILGTVQSVFESIGGILASIWGAIVNFLTGGGDKKSSATGATRTVSRTKHSRKRAPIVQEVDSVNTTMNTVSETADTIKGSVEKISETVDSAAETVNGTLETINGLIEQAQTTADTVLGGSGDYSFVFDTINSLIQGSIPSIEGAEGSSGEALQLIDGLLGISSDAELSAEGIEAALTGFEEYLGLAAESTQGSEWQTELPEGFEALVTSLNTTNANAETTTETVQDTRTFIEKVGDGFKGILDALAPWAIGIGAQVTTMNALQTAKSVPKSINNILTTIATIKYGPKAMQSESRTTKFLKIAGSIALLGGAIYLIARSISIIGKMKPEELKRGGVTIAIIIAVLTGLSAAIGAMGKKGTFGSLKDITTGVGGAIVAVLGIVAAIWLISKIKDNDLIRGGIVLGSIFLFLGILFVGINKLNKGKGITASMNGIWGLSAVILALVAAMWIIGHMRIGTIIKGTFGLIALAVAMRIFMGSMAKVGNSMNGKGVRWGWILSLAILIMVLTKTIKTLGSMDTVQLAQGLIAMALMLVAVSLTLKSISKSGAITSILGRNGGSPLKSILGMVILVSVLTAAIVKLGSMPTDKLLAAGAVLTAVLFTSSLMIGKIGKLKVKKGNWSGVVSMLGSLVLIGGLMFAFYAVAKGLAEVPTTVISSIGAALKGILLAASVLMYSLNHSGKYGIGENPFKAALGAFLKLIAVFTAIGLVIGALMLLTKIPGFNSELASVGRTIGEFIGNIAGALLAAKMKSFAMNMNAYAEEMGGIEDPGNNLLTKTQWAIDIAKTIKEFEDSLTSAGDASSLTLSNVIVGILQSWGAIAFYNSIGSFGTNFGIFADAMEKVPAETLSEDDKNALAQKTEYAIDIARVIHDFNDEIVDAGGEKAVSIGTAAAQVLKGWAVNVAWGNIATFGVKFEMFATGMGAIQNEHLTENFEDKVSRAVEIAKYIHQFETDVSAEGIDGALGSLVSQFAFGQFINNLGNFGPAFNTFAQNINKIDDPSSEENHLKEKTTWAIEIAGLIADMAIGMSKGRDDIEGAIAGWINQFSFGKFIDNLGEFGTSFYKYEQQINKLSFAKTTKLMPGMERLEVVPLTDEEIAENIKDFKTRSNFAIEIATSLVGLASTFSDSESVLTALAGLIDQGAFTKFLNNVPSIATAVVQYAENLTWLFATTDLERIEKYGDASERLDLDIEEFTKRHNTLVSALGGLINTFAGSDENSPNASKLNAANKTIDAVGKFLGNRDQKDGLLGYITYIKDFGADADITDQATYASEALSVLTGFVGDLSNLNITETVGSILTGRTLGTKDKFKVISGLIQDFANLLYNNKETIMDIGTESSPLRSGLVLATEQISALATAVSGMTGVTELGSMAFTGALTNTINLMATLGESINQFVLSTKTIDDTEMDSAIAAIDSIYTTVSEHVLGTATSIIEGIKTANSEAIASLGEMLGLSEGSEMSTTASSAGTAVATAYIDALKTGLTSRETLDSFDAGPGSDLHTLVIVIKSALNSGASEFNRVGLNYATGLANGMTSKEGIGLVRLASNKLGTAAIVPLKLSLREHSPSRVAAEIGMFFDMGLANGITNNVGLVTTAANKLGDGVTKASNEVFSAVVQALNEGVDYDPVIRPVLDLSNVRAGANTMNSLLGNRTFGLTSAELANRVASSGAIGRNANLAENLKSVNDRLDNLGEAMTHLKVVMNSGVIAGEIAPEIDKNLGKVISRKGRG